MARAGHGWEGGKERGQIAKRQASVFGLGNLLSGFSCEAEVSPPGHVNCFKEENLEARWEGKNKGVSSARVVSHPRPPATTFQTQMCLDPRQTRR